jgi:hypothetical protein
MDTYNTTTDNSQQCTSNNDTEMVAAPEDPLLDFANALPPPSENDTAPPELAEETTTPPPQLDDVERMICHEHFPALLAKATKVKGMREKMEMNSVGAPTSNGSMLDPNQVIAAVTRMKAALSNKQDTDMPVVRKGTYPLTDSMLEESFEVLQKELERCESWYEQRKLNAAGGKRNANGEPIVVKYAKWQTDILMNWMIEHKSHPFPDANQIKDLGDKTGLSQSQIVNWTTNVRKRNLKATVEQGKKPHHFIDFVFLANDRERREAQGLEPLPVSVKGQPRRKKQKKAPKPASPPHQYHHHPADAAFRPHPSGHHGYYSQPPPSHHHSMQHHHQPPHQQEGSGYHQYYQHAPYPPPPPLYYQQPTSMVPQPPPDHEWERTLGVVSESFDEDRVQHAAAPPHQRETLDSYAAAWTNAQPMAQPSSYATMLEEVDVIAAATLEKALMADTMEPTPQRAGRDSLNSIEMIDLDDSNCFLDDYDFKNVTGI